MRFAVAAVLVSLVAATADVRAGVIVVRADGSGDQPSIQDALFAAAPGDSVVLPDSLYTGAGNRDVVFQGRSVVVTSQAGDPAACVIACGGSAAEPHRGFVFASGEDTTTVLAGVTIRGGWAADGGSALLVEGGATAPLVSDCVLEGCTGRAVAYRGGPATGERGGVLRRCTLAGNDGGAVLVESDWHPVFADCVFADNHTAEAGGAIRYTWLSRGRLERCVFTGNTAVGDGGAVYAPWEQSTVVTDCEFRGNGGRDGGAWCNPMGVSKRGAGGAKNAEQFVGCLFEGNTASRRGGALSFARDCFQTFADCVFRDNAAGEAGGAVADAYVNHNEYRTCLFAGNAAPAGGAVWVLGDPAGPPGAGSSFRRCTFVANDAAVGSGFLYRDFAGGVVLEACLLAEGTGGAAIALENSVAPEIACTDIWGHAGGDWTGAVAPLLGDAGNFTADPRFAAPWDGDYGLLDVSPCLPGGHPDGADCGIVGARGQVAVAAPRILGVADVPGDQGGMVRLSWLAAAYDDPRASEPVVLYAVYRRQDAAAPAGDKLAGWDYVGCVPVRGDEAYQAVYATLCDSTAAGPCPSVFMVSGVTADPFVFYDSQPDSGCSADNLPPATPTGFAVAGTEILGWDPVVDADFATFRLYGAEAAVLDDTARLLGATSLLRLSVAGEAHAYYLLTALDRAGNESAPAVLGGVSAVGATGDRFALLGNAPNPCNPATAIRFSLDAPHRVTLAVYDLAGRRVRTLAAGEILGAGRHARTWDGRGADGRVVAAGVYLSRLEAGPHTAVGRMLLLK